MTDHSHRDAALTGAAAHLLARYAWAVDEGAYDELLEVFTPDVCADYQAFTCRGAAGLAGKMAELHHGLRTTQHLVGSVLATSRDDGSVDVRSHVRATLVGDQGRIEVAASYRDHMISTPNGWRIADRRVEGRWVSGDRSMLPWLRTPEDRTADSSPAAVCDATSTGGED